MSDDTPIDKDPEADLRPSERLVLRVLREHDGELPLSDVREETGLPERTARGAAEGLEAKGLLDRRKQYADPRQFRWTLESEC
jgi:DNA-binding MarR family transcriptional regulator